MNRFPEKNKGENLAASHVNDLGTAITRLEGGRVSNASYMASTKSHIASPQHIQGLAKITKGIIDDEDTLYSGLYLCKFRDLRKADPPTTPADKWMDDDTEYVMDIRGTSGTYNPQYDLFLMINDVIPCWYDTESGFVIPIEIPRLRRGVVFEDAVPTNFFLCAINYDPLGDVIDEEAPKIYVRLPEANYPRVIVNQRIDIFYDRALSSWIPFRPYSPLVRFTLLENLDTGSADAHIKDMLGNFLLEDVIRDPESIFEELVIGDTGLALYQEGNFYIIQAPCGEP